MTHTDQSTANPAALAELTADVVSAYVSKNPVSTMDLPGLIGEVHAALSRVAAGQPTPEAERPKPAVSPRKSVFPDYIICLEDGKKFKSLKRHLNVHYNLTPPQYREKWKLPNDYPMVAPKYAEERSRLAKALGLGLGGARKKKK